MWVNRKERKIYPAKAGGFAKDAIINANNGLNEQKDGNFLFVG
jgi:hypothetical protein